MHFLGERVLDHILCGDSMSSLERRSRLLSHWLQVCRLLKARGDMVGYLAITMAILSPPILRLRETWSTIHPELHREISETGGKAMRILERRRLDGQPLQTLDGRVFIPRRIGVDIPCEEGVPYFGDLLHCMDDAHASRGKTINFQKIVEGLHAVIHSVGIWEKEWVNSRAFSGSKSDKLVDQIQDCLEQLNSTNQNPPSINSTMFYDKSLTCESAATGLYLNSHYHQRLPLSTGSNIPLLFTDLPASFSLFDRQDTLAFSGTLHKKTPSSGMASPSTGGYTSTANSNHTLKPPSSQSSQTIRRTHSFPPSISAQTTGYDDLDSTTRERTAVLQGGDNAMLRAIRDVAGVGQQLFHSKDGELVLKAITDESRSRPVSLIETTSNRHSTSSRRYSEAMTGAPLEEVPSNQAELSKSSRLQSEHSRDILVVPKGGTLERLVDILVLGVEDFSKRMNRSDGHELEKPNLKMNMDVFTITFFATFRR